jgi:hypothetical protein
LISLLTILACSFIGAHEVGVISTFEAAAQGPVALALATSAHAGQPGSGLGYIEHIEWAKFGDADSLRIYPSDAGRQASTHLVSPDEAWAEVLALAPTADVPGMRDQFVCHWRFAEFAEPGKASWNLEPSRPEVDNATMVWSLCNPGGAEESF